MLGLTRATPLRECQLALACSVLIVQFPLLFNTDAPLLVAPKGGFDLLWRLDVLNTALAIERPEFGCECDLVSGAAGRNHSYLKEDLPEKGGRESGK